MKVALCISGQPRYLDRSIDQYQNILKHNDVDVYAHMWWDESYKGKSFVWESKDKYPTDYDALEDFKEKFNPVKLIAEPHKGKEFFGYDQYPDNCLFDGGMDPAITKSIIHRQRSQWYSINQSMSFPELKDYDFIVRARTDVSIVEPIVFDNYTPDKIYMMDGALQCGGDRHYQDWFWFGPYDMMMKLNKTYDRIIPFYKDGLKHMYQMIQHSIEESEVPGELLDLKVYLMKRNGIDTTEQKKIIKNKTEDLQVDLV